jgi:hypothetical protein
MVALCIAQVLYSAESLANLRIMSRRRADNRKAEEMTMGWARELSGDDW